jgi:hypothetical protein
MGEKVMTRILKDWVDEPWLYGALLLGANAIGLLVNLT